MSGGALRVLFAGVAFVAVAITPALAQGQGSSPPPVAKTQPTLPAATVVKAYDEFVAKRTNGCTSGTKDVHRAYYILVDKSTSISAKEWAMMMAGLTKGVTHKSILSEFEVQHGGRNPKYLLIQIQFANQAMIIKAACVESLDDMKRFAAENFSAARESAPYLGTHTHINKAFAHMLDLQASFQRQGWRALKTKAVLVADGREQGSEEALREVLKVVEASCIEVDTVAIVPPDGSPGGSDNAQTLIEYLKTIHTRPGAECEVPFESADGKVRKYPEPLIAGQTFTAFGFTNVGPAIRKALGLGGG